jgi:hypothetical protein
VAGAPQLTFADRAPRLALSPAADARAASPRCRTGIITRLAVA